MRYGKQHTICLGKTGLRFLPPALFGYPELRELIVSDKYWDEKSEVWVECEGNGQPNRLYALPKELQKLHKLEVLRLGGNWNENWPIDDISVLARLSELRILDVSGNQISCIPALRTLQKVQILDLSNNEIKDLSNLDGLSELRSLYVSFNQIQSLDRLPELDQLSELDVSGNLIRSLARIGRFPQLHKLYLRRNQIQDLSELQLPHKLTTLDLSKNQIRDIRPLLPYLRKGMDISMKEYEIDGKINLFQNPIQQPPLEILNKGREAILNYFDNLEASEEAKLQEAKILLVGEGGVGKTTLVRKLMDAKAEMPAPDASTRGISISLLRFHQSDGTPFEAHIWDFGGQEIYHATHRFFLTKRSLYLLLTETRRQDDNFDYWIPNIHLFGGNSPIMVIQNIFQGGHHSLSIGHYRNQSAFNIVESVLEVNLKTNQNLDLLKQKVLNQLTSLSHIVEDTIPKSWMQVRERLGNLAKERPLLGLDRFMEICEEYQINKRQAFTVGEYLHDLGIILWFNNILGLKDKIILRPEWATRAVYQIIDDDQVNENKGHIDREDLQRIWQGDEYQYLHDELIALMKAFRLCFQKKNRDEYLILGLLPVDPQHEIDWPHAKGLTIRYEYTFIPKGIVNELTTLLIRYVKEQDVSYIWSRGVWLSDEGTDVIIHEDRRNRSVEVRASGLNPAGMMKMIQKELDDIHETLPGIYVEKLVPCSCQRCAKSNRPKMISYDELIGMLRENRHSWHCNFGGESVSIEKLLLRVGITPIKITPRNRNRD
ncbi:MAG: COR domain-containing protein [Bacteroidota bacterium]